MTAYLEKERLNDGGEGLQVCVWVCAMVFSGKCGFVRVLNRLSRDFRGLKLYRL